MHHYQVSVPARDVGSGPIARQVGTHRGVPLQLLSLFFVHVHVHVNVNEIICGIFKNQSRKSTPSVKG